MPAIRLENILQSLRGLRVKHEADSDGELLDLFLARRDEPAFRELLRRHGPMVMGVCRRILGNADDADDAFQATFLVLVRRGDSIRPRGMVGNFLYGVACRTAREARRASAQRRHKEASVIPRSDPEEDDTWAELKPVLDRELSRLPLRFRAPLLLCDIEGKTRKEAACQLGWPEGTVSSRLSRARAMLARRLKRHAPTLSGGALVLVLSGNAEAGVPASLAGSIIKAAMLLAAGQAVDAGVISAGALALTKTVVRNMWVMKLKMTTVVLLAVGLMGVAAYQGLAQGQPKETQKSTQAARVGVAAPVDGEKKAEAAAPKVNAVSVKSLPPVVVKTVPQAGDTSVDAAKVKEIRVTFSKDMKDKSWSWSQISDETFPKDAGDIHYEKDRRTCVMPVKLEPGKTYVLWLNPEKFKGFRDTEGHPAGPYLLVFETKP